VGEGEGEKRSVLQTCRLDAFLEAGLGGGMLHRNDVVPLPLLHGIK
jgi:hypothetical protein